MRILVIDVGTNTTLHLIADLEGGGLRVVERGLAGNLLGEGLTQDGLLPDETLEHNREILKGLAEKGREQGCARLHGAGSHALRRAVNRDAFVTMAQQAGFEFEVISEAREAELGWLGVFGPDGSDSRAALLDLGGGSTELTVGSGTAIEKSQSIPTGAVNFRRQVFTGDPPTREEVLSAVAKARKVFNGWDGSTGVPDNLTGVAGTITTLAALQHHITEFHYGAVEGTSLTVEEVANWATRLTRMSTGERELLPGMPPARAGSIHTGAILLAAAMEALETDHLTISERGILFGIAYAAAAKG